MKIEESLSEILKLWIVGLHLSSGELKHHHLFPACLWSDRAKPVEYQHQASLRTVVVTGLAWQSCALSLWEFHWVKLFLHQHQQRSWMTSTLPSLVPHFLQKHKSNHPSIYLEGGSASREIDIKLWFLIYDKVQNNYCSSWKRAHNDNNQKTLLHSLARSLITYTLHDKVSPFTVHLFLYRVVTT